MHRVVCCYPDYDALVGAAAERAQRFLVLSFPRPRWLIRAGFGAMNVACRALRWEYRTLDPPAAGADRRRRAARAARSPRNRRGRIWQVAALERRASRLGQDRQARRYDRPMAVTAQPRLDAQQASRRLPDLRAPHPREAARLPRLGGVVAEAAAGAGRDDDVLRDVLREHPPRRLRPGRARDGGLRGGARDRARLRQRASPRARSSSRGTSTAALERRRLRLGPRQPRARGTSFSSPSSSTTPTSCPGSTSPGGPAPSSESCPVDDQGELQLDDLDALVARGRPKVLAVHRRLQLPRARSPRCRELVEWAHDARRDRRRGRRPGGSAHGRSTSRRSAPTSSPSRGTRCAGRPGIGALWGRAELLEAMSPFELGGHMIRKVTVEKTTWNEIPHKFEAGTRADRRGGRARGRDRLRDRGRASPRSSAHEHELTEYALGPPRARFPACVSTGPPPDRRVGIVSFTSRASIRTTSPRSWTPRASPSAPATTATSR